MGCIDISQFNVNFRDTNVSQELEVDHLTVDFTGEGYSGEISEDALESSIVTNALDIMLVESAFFARPPIKTTLLTITAKVLPGSSFNTNLGGAYYVKEGDDGDLKDNADAFKRAEQVQVYLNGSNMIKGEQVIWTSKWSFVFGFAVDPGDVIKVLS